MGGKGIFACEQWDVFSDVSVPLDANGYVTIKVEDEFGEFHQLKRKDSGTWVNWGMFYQIWVKIREVGKWQASDYTVKVDADAVFVPQRLRTWLSSKPGDSPHGLYYENCPYVQYGFFGHLEIITKTAVQVLTANLEECHSVFAPCANDGCPFAVPEDIDDDPWVPCQPFNAPPLTASFRQTRGPRPRPSLSSSWTTWHNSHL